MRKTWKSFFFLFIIVRFSSLSSNHYERCQKTFKRMKIQKLRYIINKMFEWSQDHYIKTVIVSQWCRPHWHYPRNRNENYSLVVKIILEIQYFPNANQKV